MKTQTTNTMEFKGSKGEFNLCFYENLNTREIACLQSEDPNAVDGFNISYSYLESKEVHRANFKLFSNSNKILDSLRKIILLHKDLNIVIDFEKTTDGDLLLATLLRKELDNAEKLIENILTT